MSNFAILTIILLAGYVLVEVFIFACIVSGDRSRPVPPSSAPPSVPVRTRLEGR
jgi:hypothetical protein